jgi:hypothetical protein
MPSQIAVQKINSFSLNPCFVSDFLVKILCCIFVIFEQSCNVGLERTVLKHYK